MFRFLPLCLCMFGVAAAMLPLRAETVAFRGGDLFAAELSTVKPDVIQENKYAFTENFDNKIYAALVLKVASGRALSIYDYSIQAFGTVYPCVAIRTGNGKFNAADWEIRNPSGSTFYTLLFVLDARQVGLKQVEQLELRSNFPPPERELQTIALKNLGNHPFTAPGSIPATGIMQAAR